MIHTGNKPFDCPICNFSFAQSGFLKNPIRIHIKQNPFSVLLAQIYLLQETFERLWIEIGSGFKWSPPNTSIRASFRKWQGDYHGITDGTLRGREQGGRQFGFL